MVNWKYLLLAQYPAFFILAVLFLIGYLLARKSSAVKSVLWVLLFGVALAAAVLCAFLGIHYGFWSLKTLFAFGAASWVGVALVLVAIIARTVHVVEKKRSKKMMEKELQRAAKEKDDALAQAREEAAEIARQALEEGRREARQEAEAARLAQAQADAAMEAAESFAQEAAEPTELKLD